ncbi:hypothetical protein AAG570_011494 [Ranatra chinensis]|uniref:Deoxyhypusine hydroxylase n=1 Tax=Ranatra chinensis TaxID=642074 RepID=A0ABD0YKS8_9HEMI
MSSSVVLQNKVSRIGEILNDASKPLKQRFRALFTLKNIGGEESIACIAECFSDPSVLFKHELAYCLGQMKDERALPILISVLRNQFQEPMVRHEAAEAIGAIGCDSTLAILEEYSSDPTREVAETCYLALKRIKWIRENEQSSTESPYHSVDPTPSAECKTVSQLKSELLNEEEDLFNRYMAMFALRNINSSDSVLALCEGLFCGSDLFRHEVAFVLGQLQNELSIPHLIRALEDLTQNEMVRHECAEALGSIATPECVHVLRQFQADKCRVVSESCDIALDMADYEKSFEFQYANTAALVN